jgi:uncharacterized protein YbjT (DUF2867 family)
MTVLLSGASGFIGGRLAQPLVDAGHDVRAMTRRPEAYDGAGTAVAGDTDDEESLVAAMSGCDAAYYLVHGLDGGGDFEEGDARAARTFGRAAARAGVGQLIYLGGLGRQGDDLSDHLASRQEVEGRLGQSGVPVTTLRAALVIGRGSASFELLRQVVQNLPLVVIPPKASTTRVQPIAIDDVIRYLVGVLGDPRARNATFEVGGPDVMTYEQMLHVMARRLGKDTPGVKVPIIPSLLAKIGIRVVTDVDPQLAATLLESLGNDVVVTDGGRLAALLPGRLQTFDEMLDAALEDAG